MSHFDEYVNVHHRFMTLHLSEETSYCTMKIAIGVLREIIREAAYAGMFKKGDHVLFGKYKNKKGKIVAVYLDDKDHPTIDIEPIPKGRKKTVSMGLYKIWKPNEDFDEVPVKESVVVTEQDRHVRGPWIVRAGVEIMVRRETDPIDTWRPHVTQHVNYFTDADRTSGPSSASREQVWTFRDGDFLIAVRDEQFLTRPAWRFYPPRNKPKAISESADITIGTVRGSPARGFSVRLTKDWKMHDNESAWWKLRRILVTLGRETEREAWLTQDYFSDGSDTEQFIDIPLRSPDAATARLEKEAIIGDFESAGFKVEVGAEPSSRPPRHPYR